MLVFWWCFVLFSFRPISSGYIETVSVSGCESCRLHLTCRHLGSVIAIFKAEFVNEEIIINNTNNTELEINNTIIVPSAPVRRNVFPPIHPRQALNRRCSGVNHCSFILTEDCPGADLWGRGTLNITYACISEDRIRKFCNSEILLPDTKDSGISEGFIHNPGYPRFYSSEKECRWKIRAPNQQKIKVTILDIAVSSSENRIFADECTDHLEIIDDHTQVSHTLCKPQDPPLEIQSVGDSLDVVLASFHSLIPLRGVLVHYTAVGCPTPLAPEDGYLVYRNDTAAEFRCCVGFVFADSGERGRTLTCSGAHWDAELPLPNCLRANRVPAVQEILITQKEMASDLIAPVLLIVALFLINSVVLFYIYRMKQRNVLEIEDEELGTLQPINKTSP